jgi:hypothetical protein
MAGKNKGGREVRKPKQAKTAKAPASSHPVANVTAPKKAK